MPKRKRGAPKLGRHLQGSLRQKRGNGEGCKRQCNSRGESARATAPPTVEEPTPHAEERPGGVCWAGGHLGAHVIASIIGNWLLCSDPGTT
eukprot:CAMPEP_0183380242 /NCGR_PEP_ID=MMETSP0164_2-20130417/125833_1 /TAXON_ID=221442 /ORGANISM="Coccolithus pelagicus ssp braarudi, Strain PLY182g" /LENGTH=90 /DNA_ID=CAMNT_0025557839 /DNA_START=737 /DNA_END=1009 /DNA_ORIENTATION=+